MPAELSEAYEMYKLLLLIDDPTIDPAFKRKTGIINLDIREEFSEQVKLDRMMQANGLDIEQLEEMERIKAKQKRIQDETMKNKRIMLNRAITSL